MWVQNHKGGYVNTDKVYKFNIDHVEVEINREGNAQRCNKYCVVFYHVTAKPEWFSELFDTKAEAQASLDKLIDRISK